MLVRDMCLAFFKKLSNVHFIMFAGSGGTVKVFDRTPFILFGIYQRVIVDQQTAACRIASGEVDRLTGTELEYIISYGNFPHIFKDLAFMGRDNKYTTRTQFGCFAPDSTFQFAL